MVDLDRATAVRVAASAAGVEGLVVCAEGVTGGRITGEFRLEGPAEFFALMDALTIPVRDDGGKVFVGCGRAPPIPAYGLEPVPAAPIEAVAPAPVKRRPKSVVLIPGGAPLEKVLGAFGDVEAIGSDLVLSGDDLEGAESVAKRFLACPSSGEVRVAVVRVSSSTTKDDLLGWFARLDWLQVDPGEAQVRAGSRFGVASGVDRQRSHGQVLLKARLAGSVFRQLQVNDGVDVPVQNAVLTQTTGATQQSVTYRTVGVRVTATPLDFSSSWRAVMRVELSDVVGGLALLPNIATSSFEGDLRGPGPQVLYGRARTTTSKSNARGLARFSRHDEVAGDTVAVVADMVPQRCSVG